MRVVLTRRCACDVTRPKSTIYSAQNINEDFQLCRRLSILHTLVRRGMCTRPKPRRPLAHQAGSKREEGSRCGLNLLSLIAALHSHTHKERQCQTADGHNLRPLKAVSRGKCQLLALTFQIGCLTLVHRAGEFLLRQVTMDGLSAHQVCFLLRTESGLQTFIDAANCFVEWIKGTTYGAERGWQQSFVLLCVILAPF